MDDRLLHFYTNRIFSFGVNDPRGLGWRDSVSQQSRFKVLCEIADLNGASILDEGCGFGDLYPYLTERFTGVTYKGIDINQEAITAAKVKYPDATFETADFAEYQSEKVDYVLSSGALTFRIPNHKEVYFAHIRKMYELSRKGVAFNMLDARGITEDETYAGYDPVDVYNFCRTLTPTLTLRHDYSTEDFTVYLYR